MLKHGLDHLKFNTDFDKRIALISIDNAVEIMIKTYLSLPSRITGIKGIKRKEFEEKSRNFDNLLDLFESFAPDKIRGTELGDIQWYHRIRNQLYHEGNGITVESRTIATYSEIAKILFSNLFEIPVEVEAITKPQGLIGEMLNSWAFLEQLLISYYKEDYKKFRDEDIYDDFITFLISEKVISEKLKEFYNLRNLIAHKSEIISEKDLIQFNNIIKDNIEKIIKKTIIELSEKYSRLQLKEIIEKLGINNEDLIVGVILEMIKNREIYAEYFESTKSVVFSIGVPFDDEIEKLMKQYEKFERNFESKSVMKYRTKGTLTIHSDYLEIKMNVVPQDMKDVPLIIRFPSDQDLNFLDILPEICKILKIHTSDIIFATIGGYLLTNENYEKPLKELVDNYGNVFEIIDKS